MSLIKKNQHGFGALELLLSIIVASIAYFATRLILNYVDVCDVLEGLQKLAFLIGGLTVAAFHLKFKLLDLSGKTSYSVSEQRRLSDIVVSRTRTLSYLIIFYIITASLMGAAPLLGKIRLLPNIVATVSIIMLFLSIYSAIIVLLSFNEVARFKLKLDDREIEAKERERLLNKLNGK